MATGAASPINIVHNISYTVDVSPLDSLGSRLRTLLSVAEKLKGALTTGGASAAKAYDDVLVKIGQFSAQNSAITKAIQDQAKAVANMAKAYGSASGSGGGGRNNGGATSTNAAISQQIGLIGQLEAEYERLGRLQRATFDPTEVKRFSKEMFIVRNQLNQLTSTSSRAARGVSGLQYAGAQVLREAPAFLYSFQTGILAISNNIPTLLDEIGSLRAAGGSTRDIFKQLGQSIFGVTGLITIGVAALTFLGDRLTKVDKDTQKLIDSVDELKASLAALPSEVAVNIRINQDRAEIFQRVLASDFSSANVSRNALEDLKQLVPAIKGLSDSDIISGAATDQIQEMVKSAQNYEGVLKKIETTEKSLQALRELQAKGFDAQLSALGRFEYLADVATTGAGTGGVFYGDALNRFLAIPEQISDLERQRVQDVEYAAFLYGQINDYNKETAKTTKDVKDLLPEILRDISKVNDEIRRTRLTDILTTGDIQASVGSDRVEANLTLDNRIAEAKRNGQYTNAVANAFNELRRVTNRKFERQEQIETEKNNRKILEADERFALESIKIADDLNKKRLESAKENNEDITDALIDSATTSGALYEAEREAAFNKRIRDEEEYISDLRTLVANGDESAEEQLKTHLANLSVIQKEYEDSQLEDVKQYQLRITNAIEEASKNRVRLINNGSDLTQSSASANDSTFVNLLINEYDTDLISYRRYLREKNQISLIAYRAELAAEEQRNRNLLDEAEATLQKLKDTGATSGAIEGQQVVVNRARTNLSNSRAAQTGLAAPRTGLGLALFGQVGDNETVSEARLKEITDLINVYSALEQAGVTAYMSIAEASRNALNLEIEARQERVDRARELAETGNTEILRIEEERLRESLRQREIAARREQQINAALTLSSSILAVAQAAAQSGGAAIVVVPAVLAALGAGFAFASSLASSANSDPGFADGVIDLQGPGTGKSDSIRAWLSKGETVMTAEETSEYKPYLKGMRDGYFYEMIALRYAPLMRKSEDISELKKELGELKEAIYDTRVSVNAKQSMDAYGLTQTLTTVQKKQNHRFKS